MWIVIRFYVEYNLSGCDRSYLYSNGSVQLRLKKVIRILKQCFLFIILVFYDHDFISNVVFVIDSYEVYENCVFLYL